MARDGNRGGSESDRIHDGTGRGPGSSHSLRISELSDEDRTHDHSFRKLGAGLHETPSSGNQASGLSQTLPTPVAGKEPSTAAATRLGRLGLAPRRTPDTGELIANRYRVIRVLGEGGMGVVLEVTHARLGKSFALKLLRPNYSDDPAMRSSFFREAKYASSLAHPNLISVLDYGETLDLGPYMVMELARGVLLAQYLHKRRKLQIKRACDIVLQMAEALAYIHQQNLIHCDLKPQNVMLIASETSTRKVYTIKLLDFGLAQSRATRGGDNIFGTPRYLSPEVAMRQQPTELSDVYSLGVLFFELLTGQPPFGGTTLELLEAHICVTPPQVAQLRGEHVDPALEQLIATALAKRPTARQRSMSAFIYELKNFMQMSGITSPRTTQGPASAPTPIEDQRPLQVAAAFDALRLPLATVDAHCTILAANPAFSKFILGMRVRIEGSRLQESALASAWITMEQDVASACSGVSIGRRVEVDLESGELVRLRMWLEPTQCEGSAVLSLYPESSRASGP